MKNKKRGGKRKEERKVLKEKKRERTEKKRKMNFTVKFSSVSTAFYGIKFFKSALVASS